MYVLILDIADLFAREAGLEPTTYGFGDRHSTNWATPVCFSCIPSAAPAQPDRAHKNYEWKNVAEYLPL